MREVMDKPLFPEKTRLDFSVIRVPFFLEPDYPEDVPFVETNRERLIRKWGGTKGWEQQKSNHDLKGRGLEAGIPHFNLDRLASNSFASHRLIQHIGKKFGLSASEKLYDRLNVYHFVEGHALNDRPRLASVASDELRSIVEPSAEGATEEELLEFLNGHDGTDEINRAMQALRSLGIYSIPKFIIEGQTVVDGAARWTTFVECFRHIEKRGTVNGGPIFADILGIDEGTVLQGSCGRNESVAA